MLVRKPNGAVIPSSRKVFERVGRPNGWVEVPLAENAPRVLFLASDMNGGGRVRSIWPAQALRGPCGGVRGRA